MKRFIILLQACLAVLGLAGLAKADPFLHPFNEWREYHQNWLSVCPNYANGEGRFSGGYCWTVASTGGEAGFSYRNNLRVLRNKETGEAIVELSVLWSDWDQSSPMQFRFEDGKSPAVAFALSEPDVRPDGLVANTYIIENAKRVETFIDLMKSKNRLTVITPLQGEPTETAHFSLMGFTSSYQFLADYAQGPAE